MVKYLTYQEKLFSKDLIIPFIIFFISFMVMSLRRPELLTNPQPWAEDGVFWLKQTYESGLFSSLLSPQNGYYQTIGRIAYGIGLLFGIEHAVLVATIIAIILRCALLLFFLSKRLDFIPVKYRVIIGIYYLITPNVGEGYINITNAHWYLAIYLFLILISTQPCTPWGKIHDYTVLVISAFSGPFVVFILPCLFLLKLDGSKDTKDFIKKFSIFDIALILCATVQILTILLTSTEGRSSASLGASFSLLADIITSVVVGGTFAPRDSAVAFFSNNDVNMVLFTILLLILNYLFWTKHSRIKVAILFPVLVLSFSLAKPMISLDQPQWPPILSGSGERYFYIPNLFFFAMAVYVMPPKNRND